MGQANEIAEKLMTRPVSADEIRARQAATRARRDLLATLDGQLVEKTQAPSHQPRVVVSAPNVTWD